MAQTPEIFVFASGTEERLISTEDIPQDNCDGSAEKSNTVERSHTVVRTLELGTDITVDASGRAGIPGFGEVGVGAAVAGHYQVNYGTEDRVSRSVTVAAKEGTNILHTVRQYEIWETGEVLVSAGGLNRRIPFSFRRDFNMETLPPANLGCPGQAPQPVESSVESEPAPDSTLATDSASTPDAEATQQAMVETGPTDPPNLPTPTDPPVAAIPPSGSLAEAEAAAICGPDAFGNLMTKDPVFTRPPGRLSGWLSSDPAVVQLADGTSLQFDAQFVLIVEDMPQIQLLGVRVNQAGQANSWGCWFASADSDYVMPSAMRDFQTKIDAGNRAVLYRVTSAGFEQLEP